MKKGLKTILCSLIIVTVVIFVKTHVFANPTSNFPTGTSTIGTIGTSVRTVWGTVITIVEILAFAAIVFAGVRYMFASADQRADLKKGLLLLVIGSVLVFGSSMVVKFIADTADQII